MAQKDALIHKSPQAAYWDVPEVPYVRVGVAAATMPSVAAQAEAAAGVAAAAAAA